MGKMSNSVSWNPRISRDVGVRADKKESCGRKKVKFAHDNAQEYRGKVGLFAHKSDDRSPRCCLLG